MPGRPGELVPHVITARHLLWRVDKEKDPNIYLRINFRDSEPQSIPIHISEWFFHPTDESVDVAVALAPSDVTARTLQADLLSYETERFATNETIEEKAIGIGDEVFVTGLFGYHPGVKKNIPIIRVGHIAAMPEEPIKTNFTDIMGYEGMDVYLIEARSMKGLSGCPAFVHLGALLSRKDQSVGFERGGNFHFLGLVVGHFQQEIPDTDAIVIDEVDGKTVNVGLAIVAPANKVLEIIYNNPELVKARDIYIKQTTQQYSAVMDSCVDIEQTEKPFTKSDFEEALKKVSRPKSDPETT